MDEITTLRTLLDDVARRRDALVRHRAGAAGALTAALALGAAAAVTWLAAPAGLLLAGLMGTALAVAGVALVLAWRTRPAPSTPGQLARLLEEKHGGLDDVVVSAVEYAARADASPVMRARLDAAAVRALGDAPADVVVSPVETAQTVRRWRVALAALAAALVLAAVPLRQAGGIALAYLVPSRLAIAVEPGDVRVRAGRAVTIRARLSGADALVPALVAGTAAPVPMTAGDDGVFTITLPEVGATFPYHVVAGARHSDTFTVTVVHPARVTRIDLDYQYPPALALEPRHEADGGDIYAPEGTRVALTITADRAIDASALVLADGTRVPLGVRGAVASGTLAVDADGSYRIAFVDADGVEMPDDTEYFIRTLLDRPPDVRVDRPAGDRQVTSLEEVTIDARADDDFGVQSFDLVLQKPGQDEVLVPLGRGGAGQLTLNGSHTLYLEDLEVAPGDIVSYYVRARDVGRGKPSSEARSDIYFLEVKAFNDEFVAAQSQAMSAGGQAQGVQDLAAAQKELVVATWKLDSRGRKARASGSVADIQVLADAQRALEQRAAKEAGSQLQGAGAAPPNPRRRRPGPATLNTVEDDPLGLAIEAMRRAIVELDRTKTAAALPHEMEALNQLLRADADVQRRQIARQQGNGGGAGNRQTPDLSALFDQELRKQQQTNYETPQSAETREDRAEQDDPLAKLRELARRQEALSREQQDLARTQAALDAEALKRRLEKLTRDQEEVRRQLEQLAREMPERSGARDQQASRERSQGQQGQQGQQAQQGQSGQTSTGASAGASGQPGASGQAGDERQAMRDAASEMREATSGLRDQDASKASQRAERALERMRRAEEALRGSTDDDLRRRLGDLQLEARQLADAQRRLNAELARNGAPQAGAGSATPPSGTTGTATTGTGAGERRQQADEQRRLADRADRLRQRMRDLAQQARAGEGRNALDQAGREMEAGRAAELMRESAKALGAPGSGRETATPGDTRSASTTSTRPTPGDRGTPAGGATGDRPGAPSALGADAARALDRVADRLDPRGAGERSASSRLSDDLARTRDLRERLDAVDRSLDALRARGGAPAPAEGQGQAPGTRGQRPGQAGAEGEIAALQRQLADQMRQAREQVDALGRSAPDMRGGGGSTPETWQPSVSAPGTEAFKQDFARWESLKRQLLVALEKVERGLADDLRQHETRDRLNAGAADAVPDDYRRLVDKYYRSLAAPRRPER